MGKRCVITFALAALVAGGAFAWETACCEGSERCYRNAHSAIGGGLMFDAGRASLIGADTSWSQLYGGAWLFANTRLFEFSVGLVAGRVAQVSSWLVPIFAVNATLLWRMPALVARDGFAIAPLLGVAFDAVAWASGQSARSDHAVPQRAFREFSSAKLMLGVNKDSCLSESLFFRAQLMGHFGRRVGSVPMGGAMRVGVGRRL